MKMIFGKSRAELGIVLRELALQKESRIEEGPLMADHVPMLISIPPKYLVAQVIRFVTGKSAIHIARAVRKQIQELHGGAFLGPWLHGLHCGGRRGGRTAVH